MEKISYQEEKAVCEAYETLVQHGLHVGVTTLIGECLEMGHDFDSIEDLLEYLRTGILPRG